MTKPKKIVTKRTLGRKVINVFILAFAAVVSLLIFFFGFSQTSTFRNYLKDKIITEVNGSVNGQFNIESLNGSVLTSVILKNTSLVSDNDTIFKAENISIKLEPHKLIFDIIFVRQIKFYNTDINIKQDKNFVWNIDKLSKPDTSKIETVQEVQDSSSSSPYTIRVENLELTNVNFRYKAFEYSDSDNSYEIINWDDMNFTHLNLSASALADLKNSRFNLQLNHLSFVANAKKFRLNHLGGKFSISPEFAEIKDFRFYTDSTEVSINARLEQINLLGGVSLVDFKEYPLELKLEASKFHFDDLTYFIGATDILKGTPFFYVRAKGQFGDFSIEEMKLGYLNTYLDLVGRVQHLHTPEKMHITAEVKNSQMYQPDADKLLPTIGIPVMEGLTLTNFNAKFEGEPINFQSNFIGRVNNGELSADVKLDLTKEQMVYDINFSTRNVDLEPVINIKTNLNSSGRFVGVGTDPRYMRSRANINAFKSSFLDYDLDSLNLKLNARNKKISLNLETLFEESNFVSENLLDFTDTSTIGFEFVGSFDYLNLAKVFNDSTQSSNLSLSYNLSGNNLDLSSTVANLNLEIENSVLQDRFIDYTELDFIVDFDDNENRDIQLYSDVLDFNLNGKYDLRELIKLVSYESEVLSTVMLSKLTKLNPLFIVQDSLIVTSDHLKYDDITKSHQKADFNFNFKNSKLTNFILGGSNSLAASGVGYIENDSSGFSLSNEIKLNYFSRVSEGNPIYLSDIYLNLHLSRNNNLIAFKELFGNLSIEGKRIYVGSEIKNIESEISFNANKMYYDFSSNIDTSMNIASEGLISMSDSVQIIDVSNLFVSYNQSEWNNQDTIKLTYRPLSFELDNFNLFSSSANMQAEGVLYNFGEQRFDISVSDLKNDNLSKFLTFLEDPLFNLHTDLNLTLSGSFDQPIISARAVVDSLQYGNKYFGSVVGEFAYDNKLLVSNIDIINEINNVKKSVLNINGLLPVNLSFNPVSERIISERPLNLHLLSTEFNLNTFGNVLPFLKDPKGIFVADLAIGGSFDDVTYSGFAEVRNSQFTLDINNLNYNTSFKMNFEGQQAQFENLVISNTNDVKTIGTLNGTGVVNFQGLAPDNFNIDLTGELSLLAQKSKLANTNYFGDLFIQTKSPLAFNYNSSGSSLNGDLILLDTDILYSLQDEKTAQQSSDFIYKIKIDSSLIDKEELRFRKLLAEIETLDSKNNYKVNNFNFNLGFDIESSARLVIVLPNLLNQKLFIEAAGGFTYTSIDNVPRAQGTITLLPGSNLDFFKKFDATGSLRFESELSNPYLDITAKYQSEYENPSTNLQEPIAVLVKIQGPLENLGESLSSANENIQIQRGSSNIQNNVRDARYDFADAITFLMFNSFKEDLTNEQNSGVPGQFAASAGVSLAGTVLSDLVNSSVGGVINNIQLSQNQRANKSNYLYNLSGKYKNFRYSFGGSTEYIQLKNLELKVEYLFSPNFSIRGEQRRAIGSTSDLMEMIQEIGIKYNIEF